MENKFQSGFIKIKIGGKRFIVFLLFILYQGLLKLREVTCFGLFQYYRYIDSLSLTPFVNNTYYDVASQCSSRSSNIGNWSECNLICEISCTYVQILLSCVIQSYRNSFYTSFSKFVSFAISEIFYISLSNTTDFISLQSYFCFFVSN